MGVRNGFIFGSLSALLSCGIAAADLPLTTFEGDALGATPTGWTATGTGTATVEDATSGPGRVLRISSNNVSAGAFVQIFPIVEGPEFRLQFDFRANDSGKGGQVARLTTFNNNEAFMQVRLQDGANAFRLENTGGPNILTNELDPTNTYIVGNWYRFFVTGNLDTGDLRVVIVDRGPSNEFSFSVFFDSEDSATTLQGDVANKALGRFGTSVFPNQGADYQHELDNITFESLGMNLPDDEKPCTDCPLDDFNDFPDGLFSDADWQITGSGATASVETIDAASGDKAFVLESLTQFDIGGARRLLAGRNEDGSNFQTGDDYAITFDWRTDTGSRNGAIVALTEFNPNNQFWRIRTTPGSSTIEFSDFDGPDAVSGSYTVGNWYRFCITGKFSEDTYNVKVYDRGVSNSANRSVFFDSDDLGSPLTVDTLLEGVAALLVFQTFDGNSSAFKWFWDNISYAQCDPDSGPPQSDCPADLDPPGGDGALGFFDLVAYLTLFAQGCP